MCTIEAKFWRSTMKYFRLLALIVGLFLFITTACYQSSSNSNQTNLALWMSDNGKIKVLCTTAMIADLVQFIGDKDIDCLTLIQGESDPHTYQLVKGDDEKFARADIIFYNGLGLEHGPSLSNQLKDNPNAFAVADYIQKVRPEAIVQINSSIDPHIWMDISLWKESVPFISQVLVKAVPERSKEIQERATILTLKLDQVHKEVIQRLHTVPETSRYLVSSHEAFNYFARAYICPEEELVTEKWTERVMAPEGLAPDSQLSTADIKRLVDHIITFRVATVFAESNVSRDSLKKLVDACGKKGFVVHICESPLYADAMGPRGSSADSYTGMIVHDSQVIADELGKRQ